MLTFLFPWEPNARRHLLPAAGATEERRLEAVRCTPMLGAVPAEGLRSLPLPDAPALAPCTGLHSTALSLRRGRTYATAPALRSAAISDASKPASARIASVCSPRRGGGHRNDAGVAA